MPLTNTNTVAKVEPFLYPEDARSMPVRLAVSTTHLKGTVLAEVTATGLFDAYASGGAGGLAVAKAILPFTVTTDASGNIFFGTAAVSRDGQSTKTVPVWISGIFKESDLVGFDATALSTLGARRIESVSGKEVILIP